jgi:hypothetical protein
MVDGATPFLLKARDVGQFVNDTEGEHDTAAFLSGPVFEHHPKGVALPLDVCDFTVLQREEITVSRKLSVGDPPELQRFSSGIRYVALDAFRDEVSRLTHVYDTDGAAHTNQIQGGTKACGPSTHDDDVTHSFVKVCCLRFAIRIRSPAKYVFPSPAAFAVADISSRS